MARSLKSQAQTPSPRPQLAEATDLDVALVVPGPCNAREDFDEEALEELSGTIRKVGLLQPILVRPAKDRPGHWEIIAGQRRWRAVKRAGLTRIAARIVSLDDREARQVSILENLQRKDLSAIEEARGFAALLEANGRAGAVMTQTELAERLGCSQGHVANRLRLLKLPKDWQERIASGALPATHARSIVPYAKHPAILKAIDKEISRREALPNVEDFDEDVLSFCLYHTTKRMEGQQYDPKHGREVPIFTPTPQQESELQIVEAPSRHQEEPERLATNVQLWEKLQAAHARAWVKEHPQGRRASGTSGKAAKGKVESKKALTPEEDARRAKVRARRQAAALWDFKIDWLRMLIAGRLRDESIRPAAVIRVLCWFAISTPIERRGPRADDLRRAIKSIADVKIVKIVGRESEYAALCELNEAQSLSAAAELLAGWFWCDKDGPAAIVGSQAVLVTAEMLEIDLAAEWAQARAGPLTRRWFELHERASLEAAAKAWKVPLANGVGKGTIVESLLGLKKLPFPEELAKARQPKFRRGGD